MTLGISGVTVASRLDDRLEDLRARRGDAVPSLTARVRSVVLLVSSSRGGSSMVADILRRSPSLVHLRGEFNPFLRITGLAYPDSGTGSDALDGAAARALPLRMREVLDHELSLDAGRPAPSMPEGEFLLDAAWRFAVQWPHVDLPPDEWLSIAADVVATLSSRHGWPPGAVTQAGLFEVAMVERLRRHGHDLHLGYYDLPLPDGAPPAPSTSPGDGELLIEEPPFVVTQPWRRATAEDLSTAPLVLKTPSNCYRLDFVRSLFPSARVRVLHLTRNPAAAVNGLYDGWSYRGFHSHRLDGRLHLQGYAENDPQESRWWKFDLPPGWEDHSGSTLPEVCAFQWRSAHAAVLNDSVVGGPDYLRVRFEDLTGEPGRRLETVRRICSWLDVPLDPGLRAAAVQGIAPVVATVPPAPWRWLSRKEMIMSVMGPEVRSVSDELGYADQQSWS